MPLAPSPPPNSSARCRLLSCSPSTARMEKFICIICTSAGSAANPKPQPRSMLWMNSSFPMPISTHFLTFPLSVGLYPTCPTNGRTASTGSSKRWQPASFALGSVCSNPASGYTKQNAQQRLLPLLSISVSIGQAGFEPTTPCTPCKCATRLRYCPLI